jgi:hypothetical protein
LLILAIICVLTLGCKRQETVGNAPIPRLRKLANQGDAAAQARLGWLYLEGKALARDMESGAYWMQKAADQGMPAAEFQMALLYRFGTGVRQDDRQGIEWLRRSALHGLAAGQFEWSVMLAAGQGVEKDDKESMKWLRKAAEQGHARAELAWGSRLRNGKGLATNEEEAVIWFRKAADQEQPEALEALALMYLQGRGGLAKDPVKAAELFQRSAELGDIGAQTILGGMYVKGLGLSTNVIEGYKWLSVAATHAGTDVNTVKEREFAINMRDDLERVMLESQIKEAKRRAARFHARLSKADVEFTWR